MKSLNIWLGRQVIVETDNGSVAKGMLVLDGHKDAYAISVGCGMKWPISKQMVKEVKLLDE